METFKSCSSDLGEYADTQTPLSKELECIKQDLAETNNVVQKLVDRLNPFMRPCTVSVGKLDPHEVTCGTQSSFLSEIRNVRCGVNTILSRIEDIFERLDI